MWLWADGHDAVSSDELFRSYQAHVWSQSPTVFPPFLWPPFYYWVYGSAMAIVPDTLWTPRVVTLLLACTNSILAARMLVRVSRDPRATIIVVASWALSPLLARLASVALAETLTTTCLIIALDRYFLWQETNARSPLIVSAVALSCAALTRFEVWLLVAVFGLLAAIRRAPWRERLSTIAIAMIPTAAVVAVMIHGWVAAGDPFVGFTAFIGHSATMWHDRGEVAAEVMRAFFLGAPFVACLAGIGIRVFQLWLRTSGGLFVVGLLFPATIIAIGHLPTQFPSRIASLPLTLMLPLSVLVLSGFVASGSRKSTIASIVFALVATMVGWKVGDVSTVPFPHAIQAGKALRGLVNARVIAPRDVVFAEAHEWDGLGLWAFSNLKERIRFDTEPGSPKPSLFFHPRPEKLGADLYASGVRWVLVRELHFVERARRAFDVAESRAVAGYELMRVTGPKSPQSP